MTIPTPHTTAPLEVVDAKALPTPDPSAPKGGEGRSPGKLAWRRFKRDRTGMISAYVVIAFFVVALCAP